MEWSMIESIDKIITNQDKAQEEIFSKFEAANVQKIAELRVKRDEHLKLSNEHLRKKAELEAELNRRLVK
jgi:hypothetical protein